MLQQEAPGAVVKTVLSQAHRLCQIKKVETTMSSPSHSNSDEHNLSVLVFSDEARSDENGQLCYIAGLLIDGLPK